MACQNFHLHCCQRLWMHLKVTWRVSHDTSQDRVKDSGEQGTMAGAPWGNFLTAEKSWMLSQEHAKSNNLTYKTILFSVKQMRGQRNWISCYVSVHAWNRPSGFKAGLCVSYWLSSPCLLRVWLMRSIGLFLIAPTRKHWLWHGRIMDRQEYRQAGPSPKVN